MLNRGFEHTVIHSCSRKKIYVLMSAPSSHGKSDIVGACGMGQPTMRNTMSKQIELTLSKETKGTFVYASNEENSLITNLYLKKSQMPADAPKRITVTVAFE